MVNTCTITADINDPIDEQALDSMVKDVLSFAPRTIYRGTIFNVKNYAFRVDNLTSFHAESATFTGKIRVYLETKNRDYDLIDEICAVLKFHGCELEEVARRWR